ncbi:hypothetical protein DICPUDRAFT_155921 [Dictyostelium purpureum]|uniref:SUEL-type lectin domain-containing protein n=1 Tax=Dictyostelium purpureum TaxID=5786 RepID=F0ZV83_DICPU|nr:uncharacterized protein DICPUDRAFT_155921 [Dictyostelium purpureum]EGC32150.1 hypothetical protein DICPUDRAFT_155921 [Dictyostelium purpureum]|eukprot:XP_003291322.1 hypothetical protein DICPUDRAFT_155921 [Dictyostelium purpureum]
MKFLIITIILFFNYIYAIQLETPTSIYTNFSIDGMRCNAEGETILLDQCKNLCSHPQNIQYDTTKDKYSISIYFDESCTQLSDRQYFTCPQAQIGADQIYCNNSIKYETFSSFTLSKRGCSYTSASIGNCTQFCGETYKVVQQTNTSFNYSIISFSDEECKNEKEIPLNFTCISDNKPVSVIDTDVSIICHGSSPSNNSESSNSQSSSSNSTSNSLSSSSSSQDGSDSENSSSIVKYSILLIIFTIFNIFIL